MYKKHHKTDDLLLWQKLIAFCQGKEGEELPTRIHALSQVYGGGTGGMTTAKIEHWSSGRRLFPLWARLCVLRIAADHGWTPQNENDAYTCYTLWMKANPGATIDQFASDFNIQPGSEILKFT